ncbi:hypothetical protein AcW1_000087 [Taiwanofungus camphoratus]|nr:hypothetical protein AcW2_001420 [Antrodia cinnamomea]KAI0962820.1 hypothetical protein AcW1_000087 [Antrodia cinnamomea]
MSGDLDPATQSNYDNVYSEHIHFDWTVDYAQRIISGSVTHALRVRQDHTDHVIFDTLALSVEKASVDQRLVPFELGPSHKVMGSALRVPFQFSARAGALVNVTVYYKTTEDCMALQWLEKEQTQGRSFPYLFSQCQQIYARSLAPLQDTSSVKITYTASVTSVLPVLMSAIRVSPPSEGPAHDGKVIGKDAVRYEYAQRVPIPSYLIAIAGGNVRYRAFPKVDGKAWTSGVWAEPELIDAAYWEFEEAINRFLSTAETFLPPYRFGVYDVLVLPPSFPYGGMENACLTFLTPTLLVGDRSLVDVAVHELTHSWFGNGVTHAHQNHFWLNEGWTTYIERLLLGKLHSPAERGFHFVIGAKALLDDLTLYADQPRYQRLVIEFQKGEDPDDAYSRIPYDKGANLLLHLERTLGGLDVFLPYAYDYVGTFMGKSITTAQWKEHLYAYFEKQGDSAKIEALNGVDWDAWLYGEGTALPVQMEYDLTLAEQAYSLAKRWDDSRTISDASQLPFSASDLDGFASNQKLVFLERLQSYPALPAAHVARLGTVYNLAETSNPELRLRFYEVAFLDASSAAAKALAPAAVKWVVGDDGSGVLKGRMKFCRPVFRDVSRVDRALAVRYFTRSKEAFHPIARRLIEKDLGLAQ